MVIDGFHLEMLQEACGCGSTHPDSCLGCVAVVVNALQILSDPCHASDPITLEVVTVDQEMELWSVPSIGFPGLVG